MPSISITFENNDQTFTHIVTVHGKAQEGLSPKKISDVAAVIVNKVLWYGIRLVYFDRRSNRFIVYKIEETSQYCDIRNIIQNVKRILRSPTPFILLRDCYRKHIGAAQDPPKHELQINYLNPFRSLEIGDVVIAQRTRGGVKYDHYAVYIGNREVIQWNGERWDGSDASISQQDWRAFARGSVNIRTLYTPLNVTRPSQRVEVAKEYASVTNSRYDLLTQNCEHFARYILYGRRHSTQIEDAKKKMVAGAALMGVGSLVGMSLIGIGVMMNQSAKLKVNSINEILSTKNDANFPITEEKEDNE